MTALSPADLTDLLGTATAAARAAATLLRTARAEDIRSKANPRDLVTEWDTRSEALIREVLAARAPGIPILGEEGGGRLLLAHRAVGHGVDRVVVPDVDLRRLRQRPQHPRPSSPLRF